MSTLKKDPIAEAKRYLANGDKLLKDNCTIDKYGHYDDNKYVRMAGHTAYSGVLIALEPLLAEKPKGKKQLNVDYFIRMLAKKNSSMVKIFESVYSELHIGMGYDGNTDTRIKKAGWENSKILIDWAEKHLPKAEGADKTTSKKPATTKTAIKKTAK